MVLIAGLAYMLAVGEWGSWGGNQRYSGSGRIGSGRSAASTGVAADLHRIHHYQRQSSQHSEMRWTCLTSLCLQHAYAQPARPMAFQTAITLKDLGFRYTPHGPWVLRHLTLQIPKGSRVGFVGVTGSGKSTLLDIVMGLLAPNRRRAYLLITPLLTPPNTRAWQTHISHVPQAIFLSDTSIAENIAFGVARGNHRLAPS
jgi:ABC-type bacteriocin/lantibiotic exporter with double-glycine peptidase domain